MDQFSPPSPGEEVILSFSPLCHVSTQVIDIYYMISVAGTTVFPGSDIFNQQELFWKVMAEVCSLCRDTVLSLSLARLTAQLLPMKLIQLDNSSVITLTIYYFSLDTTNHSVWSAGHI